MKILMRLTARVIEMMLRFTFLAMLQILGCLVRLLYWSVRQYGWGKVSSFFVALFLGIKLSQSLRYLIPNMVSFEGIAIVTLVLWGAMLGSYLGLWHWWRWRSELKVQQTTNSDNPKGTISPVFYTAKQPNPIAQSSYISSPTSSTASGSTPMEQSLPLWKQVIHPFTMNEAWQRVLVRSGSPGSDGMTVEKFALSLERNLDQLRRELLQGKYHPLPPKWVEVPKVSGKVRRLAILCVRDRIVQQALLLVLTSLWDSQFAPCSYAYRPGRSAQKAVAEVEKGLNNGLVWVVDADIESFFDSVPHKPLFEQLSRWVSDERVISWIQTCVAGVSPSPQKGLAQGAPLSPLLANLYLHPFDIAMLNAGYRLIRYADDFIILCATRQQAEESLRMAERLLKGLGLKLNSEKTRVVHRDEGFTFLGYTFTREGKRPSEKAIVSLQSRLAAAEGDETKRRQILAGWQGYFGQVPTDLPEGVPFTSGDLNSSGDEEEELWWEELEGDGFTPPSESKEHLRLFRERFCGRSEVFARYWRSGKRQGYAPVRRPLSDDDLLSHLSGNVLLGTYLLHPDGTTRALVFDIDGTNFSEAGRKEAFALAQKMFEQLKKQGATPLWEDSGGKGFHLWLCFDQPVAASEARRWANKWLDNFRPFPEGVLVEIFPKQDRLAPNALGALLRLPLGRHPETQRFSRLLRWDGEPSEDPWALLATTPPIPASRLFAPSSMPSSTALPEPPEEVAPMVKGCSLLWGLVEKAAQTHHLRHVERLALLYTLGHCGEAGHAYLHQVIGLCANYNPRITERWWQRVEPGHRPIRCATLQEWLKDLLPGVRCSCIAQRKGDASPLDLLKQPSKERRSTALSGQPKVEDKSWEEVVKEMFGDNVS